MLKYGFEFKKKVVLEHINDGISLNRLTKKYSVTSKIYVYGLIDIKLRATMVFVLLKRTRNTILISKCQLLSNISAQRNLTETYHNRWESSIALCCVAGLICTENMVLMR